jgi:hypothetical protein
MTVDTALWNRVAADMRFEEEGTVRALIRKYCAERDFYKDRIANGRDVAFYAPLTVHMELRIDTARAIEKLLGGKEHETDEA